MTSPTHNTKFNPKAIRFPTDSITLAQIREHEDYISTADELLNAQAVHITAFLMHEYELQLAEDSFQSELGGGRPYGGRNEKLEMLNTFYCEYGISTGREKTKLLVSDFENSATDQALSIRDARTARTR
tara:strand:- start:1887 stop:2273 length:387 start_codon:yes stop_codon:yes gene_type:complete